MNRTLFSRFALVGMMLMLVTPGVIANVSVNDGPPTANLHAFDEITASTGTLVVRTSDANDAITLGLGTTAPDARLHVSHNGLAAANGAAVHVNYGNAGSSITTYGVKVDASNLAAKGSEIGVQATASKTAVVDPQSGTTTGRLALVSGFDSSGVFYGVQGVATPDSLSNWDGTKTSYAVGGSFLSNPASLTLDGTGTYWVGGVIGQAGGTVNGNAGQGASAGVIGIASAAGTAKTYAGYFKGDVKTTGDASAASLTLVNSALGTCTLGTMKYVAGGTGVADRLYMCLKSGASNTPTWVQVAAGPA